MIKIVDKALLVGIGDQERGDSTAKAAYDGVASLVPLISRNYDGSDNYSIRPLTTEEEPITRAKLRFELEDLFNDRPQRVFFYFAGHGMVTQRGGTIITSDQELRDEGILMSEVFALAEKAAREYGTRTAIVLDTCYASSSRHEPLNASTVDRVPRGVSLLTSSGSDEHAIVKQGESLYTKVLVQGLTSGAAGLTGEVTAGSLYVFISQMFKGFGMQRPEYSGSVAIGEDFLRKAEPKVRLETLAFLHRIFPDMEEPITLDPTYENSIPRADDPTDCVEGDPRNLEIMGRIRELQRQGLISIVHERDQEGLWHVAKNSGQIALTPAAYPLWLKAKREAGTFRLRGNS